MRYFLEVSYKGTNYSGFQTQKNANTVQAEIENAFHIFLKNEISLTGSSRTDAGVHAIQNFFHFDVSEEIHSDVLYNLNAILPDDIVCKNLYQVHNSAHCRFDALSREYKYYIYNKKNPFLKDYGFFYPYRLDLEKMNAAVKIIAKNTDFSPFSKANTQVKSFICNIYDCKWFMENETIVFHIKANRFLRGMVRGLTGTILKVGRNIMTLDEFKSIIDTKDAKNVSFAVPAHGLFLKAVKFPNDYFNK